MTARFELRRVAYAFGGCRPVDAIEAWVDGRSLLELVSPGVDEPLDAPLPAAELLGPDGPLWLGGRPERPDFVRHGRTAVLTCSCGEFGCGGVRARITLGETTVTWDDFLAIGGRAIDLSLTFDRAEYEAALASV